MRFGLVMQFQTLKLHCQATTQTLQLAKTPFYKLQLYDTSLLVKVDEPYVTVLLKTKKWGEGRRTI